jgi:hypothetical protein
MDFNIMNKYLISSLIGLIVIILACEKEECDNLCNCQDSELIYDSIILQPDGNQGKDAFLFDMNPDQNFGSHEDFAAIAWTNTGIPVKVRGLIEFDLSGIPADATIDKAFLSLYSYDSPSNGSHSILSGTNASILLRIVDNWTESDVTWNNQPGTSDRNIIFLKESSESIKHYLNIDVTSLVKDATSETAVKFGVMIRLVEEEYYRRLVFASSDNENSELHPSLWVHYSIEKDNLPVSD